MHALQLQLFLVRGSAGQRWYAGSPSRAASPEVSSSTMSGPGSSVSAGSLGLADFMDPQVLKTAKIWRFQKLSKAELGGLVVHFTKALPSSGATKGSCECGRGCKTDTPFLLQVLFIRQKTQSCSGFHPHCWFASAASEGYINFNDAATIQCVGSCQSVVSGILLQTLAALAARGCLKVQYDPEANLTLLTAIMATFRESATRAAHRSS
ncbi:hypothetical protein ABBQ38_008081 [Trebouxia sp. C0009 RCD-2024]